MLKSGLYFSHGAFSGYVIDQITLSDKDYILYYTDKGFLDACAVKNWYIKTEPEMIEEDGPEFDKDTCDAGQWQDWGSGWRAVNFAYYTVEGVRWRVLIDTLGWPFIIDRRQG